ncbi:MAG: hypothetical protein PVH68_08605 [Armatimonadota bacterium]
MILAYALLASLQPVLPKIGWLDMHVSTALAVALWPLAGLCVLRSPGLYVRKRKLLLLLTVVLIGRTILSPGESLRDRFVMGSIITTFFAVALFCSHPRVRLPNRRLLWAIVLGGCAVGTLKLAQFYGHLRWLHPAFAGARLSGAPEFAVRALYDDLAPVGSLAAAMALLSYRRAPVLLWLALPLNLAAAMCGGSRIFTVASLLVVLGYSAFGALLRIARWWVACVAVLVAVAPPVIGGIGWLQAGRPVLSRVHAPAMEPRMVEMSIEIETIERAPLLGAGMYRRWDPRIYYAAGRVHGHNTYTSWAAKMGVPWALGLVAFLVWVTYRLWHLSRRGDATSRPIYLAGAVQFTILLLAVQSVTNPLQMSVTSPLLAAFAGAALRDRCRRLGPEANGPPGTRAPQGAHTRGSSALVPSPRRTRGRR